jgi:hypothetical protein
MKILHSNPYDEQELRTYKHVIYRNILDAIRTLIDNTKKLGIPFENAETGKAAEDLEKIPESSIVSTGVESLITPTMGQQIKTVWKDGGIQNCFNQRNKFQLIDSAEYYLNDIGTSQ